MPAGVAESLKVCYWAATWQAMQRGPEHSELAFEALCRNSVSACFSYAVKAGCASAGCSKCTTNFVEAMLPNGSL